MLLVDGCKKPLMGLSSVLTALLTIANASSGQAASANKVQPKFGIISIRITMGLKDEQPTDWSGRMSIDRGAILRLEEWQFDRNDRIKGTSWKCQTRWAPVRPFPLWRADGTRPPVERRPRPVGIIAMLDAPPDAQLTVETPKGKVNVGLNDVKLGAPVASLDGQVSIERIPTSSAPLSPAKAFRDYPAMLIDGKGTLWIAYVQHVADAGDRVVVAYGNMKQMNEIFLTPATDIYKVALGTDKNGSVWVTWSEQRNGNWDIYGAIVSESEAKTIRLTSALEPDMEHAMVRDARGNLWVVWQGFRGGQSDILARYFDGTRWSREMRISRSDANDWQPAIAADRRGRVYIAWDSYANGNYDIFMRWIDVDKMTPSSIIQVTTSSRFQAHVTLACDDSNRLWLAWDESAPNWGKDYGFRIKALGTCLYAWRALRVACWQSGKLHQPIANLSQAMPFELPATPAYNDYPHITVDGNSRVWLFFRHRTAKIPRIDGWTAGGMWSIYGVYLNGDRWSAPILLPESYGRNDMRIASARDADGNLWLLWATDGRSFRSPSPKKLDLRIAQIPATDKAPPTPSLRPFDDVAEKAPAVHPKELSEVERIRAYEIQVGGKRYRIYRGDLHRHTDISSDGAGDGSLIDLYRYALDAVRLDFIAVTDHNAGNDREYPWWRTQRSCDLFFVRSYFVPLYAYERSVPYPNGHRNVIFAQRGVRTLPIPREERRGKVGAKALYDYLRRYNGICTSHTSATDQGTDWRDNDPELEPIVELYQGYHTSYEHPGAPRAVDEKAERIHGRFQPAGFVWNALAKGYRLGFQASSDHISTHVSYTCVYAPEFSREALLNAMRQRHTYAATDNIILDVRVGEYIMGDEIQDPVQPQLTITAIGTKPIKRLDIIHNNRIAYTIEPHSIQVRICYRDYQPMRGTNYYYVRVLQTDGQLAWSSPIWLSAIPSR